MNKVGLKPLGCTRDFKIGHSSQEPLEHHLDLATGQVGAETEMRPRAAEPNVLIRRSQHIKLMRVFENRFISVGRVVPEDRLVPGLHLLAA